MKKYKKIAVIIPCYNEEKGIGKVIDGIPVKKLKSMGYITDIIVVDNNSTDKTAHVAASLKASVIVEQRKGKGYAVKTAFAAVPFDANFVVLLDGDNTYKGHEIPRLIEPLESNFAEVIIGSRLGGKTKKYSFKMQNRIANWFYTFLVRQFYRANITDVLSGYFAWKKEVVDRLSTELISEGFEIEMEMITKMKKLGFEMYSVPITYDKRDGETKIEALKDGIRILSTLFKNLTWTPGRRRNLDVSIGSTAETTY
ncbi:MAG TPA: glycosyltransferase family 2 protein [Patescibacteria group bacterium]|nr:glycosyltransferase family 2 protein [Patescibacteria group bacterium]